MREWILTGPIDFTRRRRPVPTRRAVGAAPEPLSVDDSSDPGSSSDDDSSAVSFMEKSSSSSTCGVSFQVGFFFTFSKCVDLKMANK